MLSHRTSLLALAFSVVLLSTTGCDSTTNDPDPEPGAATYTGQVTSDEGYASRGATRSSASNAGPVEGAVVTAFAVTADGQLRPLQGRATTNAEGRFSLETDGTTGAVVLAAEKADFESSALIESGVASSGTVTVPPMNEESHAEAEVYIGTRAASPEVQVADVVAYVSARTAADLEAGTTTTTAVAAAVAAAVEAEAAFLQTEEGGDASEAEVSQAEERRSRGYATFRASITSATTAEARTNAVQAFEEAYAQAYAEGDVTASQQAEASQAGARAAVRFSGSSSASFGTVQQARLNAALATALAVEEEFEAAGASSGRLSALAQARASFVAAIRAAASAEAIAQAEAAYVSTVRTELAAEADVSTVALTSAEATTAVAETALDASVQTAASAQAVAEAYATFFVAARTAVEAALGADAALAVKVVTLLSVM